MQDTFINIGRGIDGMVGRMVDQFADTKGSPAPDDAEGVTLVRFVVVSLASGHERVVDVDETLVTDGARGAELDRRLLAPYATHVDRPHLRVHKRVLRRWPRGSAPESPVRGAAPRAEPAIPAAPAAAVPAETAVAPAAAPRKPVAAKSPTRTPAPPVVAKPTSTAPVAARPKPPAPVVGKAKPPAPVVAKPTPPKPSKPGKPATGAGDADDQRLLAILADAGDAGLSMAQLVKRTGERSANLRKRLQRLSGSGTILRVGDGLKTRYRLTEQ